MTNKEKINELIEKFKSMSFEEHLSILLDNVNKPPVKESDIILTDYEKINMNDIIQQIVDKNKN